jgi:hypothetical protein
MEHLAQDPAADAAGRQRILGEPLEDLHVLPARGALVFVGRHEGSVSGYAGPAVVDGGLPFAGTLRLPSAEA